MKVPLSWLKDFVDIPIPLGELSYRLTMAGLEVEEVQYVGLPMPTGMEADHNGENRKPETKISGLAWDPDKIVVGEVREVMPHPNADRLVLCRLYDGQAEHVVLTGAPNLFPFKGMGTLEMPLKVPYAREGARLYDGHQPGQIVTTLKRTRIRGVESYSMICSEKELGISEEHEGVIILDEEAPVGTPLVDYMGDAVLDISITPNIARDANVLGVAREVAALTRQPLRHPNYDFVAEGPSIEGQVAIDIQQPELNPRFVLGLIRGVKIGPSPYQVQYRLRLAGMRPINNIVDATNYVMLEIGQPLHAFDYDKLVLRAGSGSPTIITRTAHEGERLITLDEVERSLDDFTVLVCDTAGPLSLAGVMGGVESEVDQDTQAILLEGAAWNYINIRRTAAAQRLQSEAAYRFSRGVHPAMAERGVRRGLEMMRRLAGGVVDKGLVDNYPLPPKQPTVEITPGDIKRWLGIDIQADKVAEILENLEFKVERGDQSLIVTAPDHRLDIGEGVVGRADVMEEIARIYGYDRIPETRLADELPPQRGNLSSVREELIRDLLVNLGLLEVATYRLTSPQREARLYPPGSPKDDKPYVQIANPIASDRHVMRHSLLANLLEVIERNSRIRERIAIFEIGPVFFGSEEEALPDEIQRLAIAITGPRSLPSWQTSDMGLMDFFDLKGIIDSLVSNLQIQPVLYQPATHPSFHPGKTARLLIGERQAGILGELHPLVKEQYDLAESPVLVADLSLDALSESISEDYEVKPVPVYPPVKEDLAIIVDEAIPAARVLETIRQGGGMLVSAVELFDVFRGEQIGAGKKSLAYRLSYQAPDHTLTDQEAGQIRGRIIQRLERELGARIRS